MAAVDRERRLRQPRQGDAARRGIDADLAAKDIAVARQLKLRLTPYRQVEAFERCQVGERARQAARHQILHRQGELQGTGPLGFEGAEVECPGPRQRFDLGTARDRTAAAAVIEVDVEFRQPPDALAPIVVDDQRRRAQADLAQIGGGILAPPRPGRCIREHLDEIDAAKTAVAGGIGRNRRQRFGVAAAALAIGLADLARGGKLQRQLAVLAVVEHQARRDQVDALGRDQALQTRTGTDGKGRRRRHRERRMARVGDAHIAEFKLELMAIVEARGNVIDLDPEAGKLLGDRALERANQKTQRHRPLPQPGVEQPRRHHQHADGEQQRLADDLEDVAPVRHRLRSASACRARCRADRGFTHPLCPSPARLGHDAPSIVWRRAVALTGDRQRTPPSAARHTQTPPMTATKRGKKDERKAPHATFPASPLAATTRYVCGCGSSPPGPGSGRDGRILPAAGTAGPAGPFDSSSSLARTIFSPRINAFTSSPLMVSYSISAWVIASSLSRLPPSASRALFSPSVTMRRISSSISLAVSSDMFWRWVMAWPRKTSCWFSL